MQFQRTNTILYCQKWAETVAFYRDVFGFSISHRTDWFVEFELSAHTYLSIADEKRASIKSVSGQGITLSWEVANVHEIPKAFVEQGISVSPIRNKWGHRCFISMTLKAIGSNCGNRSVTINPFCSRVQRPLRKAIRKRPLAYR